MVFSQPGLDKTESESSGMRNIFCEINLQSISLSHYQLRSRHDAWLSTSNWLQFTSIFRLSLVSHILRKYHLYPLTPTPIPPANALGNKIWSDGATRCWLCSLMAFRKPLTGDHLLSARGSFSLSDVLLKQMFITLALNLLRGMTFPKKKSQYISIGIFSKGLDSYRLKILSWAPLFQKQLRLSPGETGWICELFKRTFVKFVVPWRWEGGKLF